MKSIAVRIVPSYPLPSLAADPDPNLRGKQFSEQLTSHLLIPTREIKEVFAHQNLPQWSSDNENYQVNILTRSIG